ncbi:hypothetical protein [Hydrogenovibrio marinus]|uniref:Uncharacterized protein n=1 Tax=Hydrogenovibrio marinus TaxID=28885 RepID=A0A066ZZ55_HYDMR|nr:hypothetical protein [Hydrogenovibrio marinus]KDN95626.1 hypothetical protein EI16_04820 [Hydrogenovibrio marinus]BBN60123.1 hypothetical protein HVMH_1717 [Hydrogenovibrio marinus]
MTNKQTDKTSPPPHEKSNHRVTIISVIITAITSIFGTWYATSSTNNSKELEIAVSAYQNSSTANEELKQWSKKVIEQKSGISLMPQLNDFNDPKESYLFTKKQIDNLIELRKPTMPADLLTVNISWKKLPENSTWGDLAKNYKENQYRFNMQKSYLEALIAIIRCNPSYYDFKYDPPSFLHKDEKEFGEPQIDKEKFEHENKFLCYDLNHSSSSKVSP